MVEHLHVESIPHGPICIAFTPDEEIGTGASHFDVELFDADLPIHWTDLQKENWSTKILMHAVLLLIFME